MLPQSTLNGPRESTGALLCVYQRHIPYLLPSTSKVYLYALLKVEGARARSCGCLASGHVGCLVSLLHRSRIILHAVLFPFQLAEEEAVVRLHLIA